MMVKDPVAQLVEHNTFNVGVLGSSPSGITKALAKAGAVRFRSLRIMMHAGHSVK